ncbi:ABC transporter ATP-binding protein [Dyadobacter crusticola]|uniref:ABC transporter ATP-binding protein n=1 Tax=Dyadobacter crusticola TaxID=292407 RepID=UPI000556BED4|nr:ATP-binding cassette domain-containing protein [Dyadobacter crusticola]
MILATNISKNYGEIRAVRNISFEVKQGETMVLLGTSGCGKTTTLKMINRLIEASSGKIEINGQNIFEQSPELLRRTIGYVSQNNGLFPHFTVRENIGIVPKLLKWGQRKTTDRTEQLLEQLQLPASEFADKYPDELSGGQKQRVAVARALIAEPAVLLMDEPFGALDPVTRAGIRHEFQRLPELKKTTIVMVTHDVQEAFELGDRISIMDKGEIVQSGTAADLLFRPAHTFISSFFDHQRLFFELSAVTFAEIWEHLPDSDGGKEPQFASEQSLWAGLGHLSTHNLQEIFIADHSGKQKRADRATIFRVFNQIKNAD